MNKRQKTKGILASALMALSPLMSGIAEESLNRVVFLGDSLTAGYALDLDQAYPALLQEKMDELGLPFTVVNSGISGDTTAGGLRRMDWLMRKRIDVLVVALGANDGLRGLSPDAMEENLNAIIDKAREHNPDIRILLAGMLLPANMGSAYKDAFDAVFPRIAGTKEVAFMPFLLENVAAVPELNLPDGIHPTAEGYRIIASNVWPHLEPLLRSGSSN
jgi:acyl-CoA thioesterase I